MIEQGNIIYAGMILLFFKYIEWNRAAKLLATLLVSYCLVYITVAGGDWMPYSRFFVPVLPILFLLAFQGLEGFIIACHPEKLGVSLLGVLIIVLLPISTYKSVKYELPKYSPQGLVDMAYWLDKNASQNARIAALSIGALSYYTNISVVDMLGLTNKEMAKSGKDLWWHKGDPDYILEMKPEYIQLSEAVVTQAFSADVERAIFYDERFKKNYVPVDSVNLVGLYARRN